MENREVNTALSHGLYFGSATLTAKASRSILFLVGSKEMWSPIVMLQESVLAFYFLTWSPNLPHYFSSETNVLLKEMCLALTCPVPSPFCSGLQKSPQASPPTPRANGRLARSAVEYPPVWADESQPADGVVLPETPWQRPMQQSVSQAALCPGESHFSKPLNFFSWLDCKRGLQGIP